MDGYSAPEKQHSPWSNEWRLSSSPAHIVLIRGLPDRHIDPDRRWDVVLRGIQLCGDYAVGIVKNCNWLQHHENIVDPTIC